MKNQPAVYQVSVAVRAGARDAACRYMNEKHIPEVVASGGFSHAEFFIEETQDSEIFAWSTLYHAPRVETIHHYTEAIAPTLRRDFEETLGAEIVSVSRKILITP